MENNFNKNNQGLSRRGGFAVLLIIIGLLFLGFNTGFISHIYKPLLLSWQMLLIGIGFLAILKKQYTSAFVLMAVGVFFLLPEINDIFPSIFNYKTLNLRSYWPLILIVVGLVIIFRKPSSRSRRDNKWIEENEDAFPDENPDTFLRNNKNIIEENVIFGSSEQILFSTEFKGGELNVMFGEIKLDLRKSQLNQQNNLLQANALFGSIIIYIPEHWKISMKKDALLAGIQDKRISKENDLSENAPILHLKCSCLLGSIEIKN